MRMRGKKKATTNPILPWRSKPPSHHDPVPVLMGFLPRVGEDSFVVGGLRLLLPLQILIIRECEATREAMRLFP